MVGFTTDRRAAHERGGFALGKNTLIYKRNNNYKTILYSNDATMFSAFTIATMACHSISPLQK